MGPLGSFSSNEIRHRGEITDWAFLAKFLTDSLAKYRLFLTGALANYRLFGFLTGGLIKYR